MKILTLALVVMGTTLNCLPALSQTIETRTTTYEPVNPTNCLPVSSQPIQTRTTTYEPVNPAYATENTTYEPVNPAYATENTTYWSTTTSQTSRLGRAQNLAREAAENANGGLSQYRAESSMYGNPENSPYVDNGNGTWTFTIKGGTPNYITPSVETIVTLSKDFSRITVDQNGLIR